MANNKQRLELTWIGKDEQPKLEPRILIEDPSKSYGDKHSENMLIYGDNLLALKALEQDYTGKVKCIFIDPPYNTGSAFTHYDDGIEHSLWLSLMRDRLEILRRLLSEDGSLWVTLDDNEAHYFRVLADEVFGRNNFVSNCIWQKKFSPQNDAKYISDQHDHILVFAKNKPIFKINKIISVDKTDRARNLDNDPRGVWKSVDYTCNKNKFERPNLYYPIMQPNTNEQIWPKETAVWRFSQERHEQNIKEKLVYWGKDGRNAVPRFKKFENPELIVGDIPTSIWFHQDVGNTQEAKKEQLKFNISDPFGTPKPERLLQRIIHLASNDGELVLDSFAGSGTTGAVAHKMGRKWIMVELGEHCDTHILPRLQKVVDGADQGGISQAQGWEGGGGFKYYDMAPSLLKKDQYGNWIIDSAYNPDMLAAAMAKQEGFRYQPDESIYWKQGQSTEKDFIFTTTNFVTVEFLDKLSEEMQPDESLLVCCKSFRKECAERYPNITIKKIPKMLLGRCEFGRDDYSLNVINLPTEDEEDHELNDCDEPELTTSTANAGKTKVAKKSSSQSTSQQLSLMGE